MAPKTPVLDLETVAILGAIKVLRSAMTRNEVILKDLELLNTPRLASIFKLYKDAAQSPLQGLQEGRWCWSIRDPELQTDWLHLEIGKSHRSLGTWIFWGDADDNPDIFHGKSRWDGKSERLQNYRPKAIHNFRGYDCTQQRLALSFLDQWMRIIKHGGLLQVEQPATQHTPTDQKKVVGLAGKETKHERNLEQNLSAAKKAGKRMKSPSQRKIAKEIGIPESTLRVQIKKGLDHAATSVIFKNATYLWEISKTRKGGDALSRAKNNNRAKKGSETCIDDLRSENGQADIEELENKDEAQVALSNLIRDAQNGETGAKDKLKQVKEKMGAEEFNKLLKTSSPTTLKSNR